MSILMQKLFGQLMNEAGDGDGGGAGAPPDRGDSLPDIDDKKVEDNLDADDAGDDKGDEDDAAAAAAKAEDKDDEDEPPRGKDGKFVKKDPVIPKARFDELRTKSREREQALLDRISDLEKQSKREAEQQDVAKINKDIEDLEETYQKQLDEGKTAEAKATMREIRMKERQITLAEAEHKSERARLLAVEQFKFDSLVEKLESDFPQLNPDADEYDQEVVDEVGLLRTGFEKAGLASSAALAKAVKYVLGSAQKKAEPEPEPKKGLSERKDARKQEQLKKNIDAAKKQPGRLDDSGMDSHKKGGGLDPSRVADMSEEEFNALPATTKARLRGDIVEDVAA